jgi:hypothetical protein
MESFLSMIFWLYFAYLPRRSLIAAAFRGRGIRAREREAVRLSATEAHEQPMPNKDEAWATESRRFLRGCRKQSGADGVAAELAKARTEDGSGPTS